MRWLTLLIFFPIMTKAASKISRSESDVCERLLIAAELEATVWAPMTNDRKWRKWERLSHKLMLNGWTASNDELKRRQDIVLSSQKTWAPIFETFLTDRGFPFTTIVHDEFTSFLIDRVDLLRHRPELRELFPPEYKFFISPFMLKVAGSSARVATVQKEIFLPVSILNGRMSVEEVHAIVHENVHIRLNRRREALGLSEFASYYLPQGSLKKNLASILVLTWMVISPKRRSLMP